MTEDNINDFVKDDKTEAAMREISNNPVLYNKIFMRIHNQLCRHCRTKVYRHYLSKQNTKLEEYCNKCQTMAKKEWEQWT